MILSEILTVVVGYIYLFLSIGINIVKVVYIFIKKKILPNLLLYYVLKVLSGCAGILYGLTFLDKVAYYLVSPFLAVLLLDFIVLGIICVLNLKQYINNLHRIHPETARKTQHKLQKIKKLKKKSNNLSKIPVVPRPRIQSMSNIPADKKTVLRKNKSKNSLKDLEETFMSNYIKHVLQDFTFSTMQPHVKRIGNNDNQEYIVEAEPKKERKNKNPKKKQKTKKNKRRKTKTKTKKKDNVKDYLADEVEGIGEDIVEEESDYLEDLEDDEDIEIDDDEDMDDDEDEDEDEEDDEESGGGFLDYIGGLLEG